MNNASLTLAVAMTLVACPEEFLAVYHAVKDGAMKKLGYVTATGNKIYLERYRGNRVRLTTPIGSY